MRDLLVVGIVLASLPVILFRPYVGLLVYGWLAYMRPQDMGWGTAAEMPLSQWVALAMLAGLVVAFGRERWLVIRPQTILLFLLVGWISLSVAMAVLPEVAGTMYGYYWKAILISILTTGLVGDRRRFRILVILIAFSVGFLGAKRGLIGLVSGGARYYDGPGGFMSDNNSFALVLNMVIPLLAGIAMVEKEKLLRMAALVVAALCAATVLFTFSRGGLLTLACVVPMLVWRSRHRLAVISLLGLAAAGFLFLTSARFAQDYTQRASSISDYERDGSAQGRFDAWTTSWRVFLDYPAFGVGPDNLAVVHPRYSPDPGRFRVSHNAYLQVLAECGLPALVLFLAVIASGFLALGRLRRGTDLPWVEVYARMMQISIVAYVVGSLFLNTAYSELIYQLVALSVSLEVAARAEVMEAAPAAEPAEPWWRRPAPQLARATRVEGA